jgi:hypothetical protein
VTKVNHQRAAKTGFSAKLLKSKRPEKIPVERNHPPARILSEQKLARVRHQHSQQNKAGTFESIVRFAGRYASKDGAENV